MKHAIKFLESVLCIRMDRIEADLENGETPRWGFAEELATVINLLEDLTEGRAAIQYKDGKE